MRITILVAVLVLIASSAMAVEMRTGPTIQMDWENGDRLEYSCDTGLADSGYYQDNLTVYGNAFNLTAGGMLNSVEFWHYAWGELTGPYDYMLYVYDMATCTVLYEIGPLQAADAAMDHMLEVVDLTSYSYMVTGEIFVGILPMSLATTGFYHPTLDFEYLPLDNCMRWIDYGSSTGCETPLDGGDFLLRITVDDTTPVSDSTFSMVKSLY